MQIHVLKSKIHTARVTQAILNYEGSIVIDADLMAATGILEFEKVLVANFTNGNRYETYAMAGEPGSGVISVNGAGARYSCVGDTVTIFAFVSIDPGEPIDPKIIVCNEDNTIKTVVRG